MEQYGHEGAGIVTAFRRAVCLCVETELEGAVKAINRSVRIEDLVTLSGVSAVKLTHSQRNEEWTTHTFHSVLARLAHTHKHTLAHSIHTTNRTDRVDSSPEEQQRHYRSHTGRQFKGGGFR